MLQETAFKKLSSGEMKEYHVHLPIRLSTENLRNIQRFLVFTEAVRLVTRLYPVIFMYFREVLVSFFATVKPRALLIFLFFIVFSESARAQLLIGPEAGANFSWVKYDDPDLKNTYKIKPVPGFHAGVHVGFRVRKRYFLHFSLQYSTKGKVMELKDQSGKNPYDNLHFHNTVRYNYIDLPILYTVDFKGKIGSNKEFKYNLGIGPVVSYWLGGKGTYENNDSYELGLGKTDYKIAFHNSTPDDHQMSIPSINRLQLGLTLGGSIIFEPVPSHTIMVTVRYEWGGTFLSSKSNGLFAKTIYQEPLASHNRGFRVSVAYLLDTKLDQRKRGKSTSKLKKHKSS